MEKRSAGNSEHWLGGGEKQAGSSACSCATQTTCALRARPPSTKASSPLRPAPSAAPLRQQRAPRRCAAARPAQRNRPLPAAGSPPRRVQPICTLQAGGGGGESAHSAVCNRGPGGGTAGLRRGSRRMRTTQPAAAPEQVTRRDKAVAPGKHRRGGAPPLQLALHCHQFCGVAGGNGTPAWQGGVHSGCGSCRNVCVCSMGGAAEAAPQRQ